MQPNPSALVNMSTISDRNLSNEQINQLALAQVWPNASTDFATGGVYKPVSSPTIGEYIDGAYVTKETSDKLRKQMDESKIKLKTEAVKFDEGKVDWTLVPFEALEDMAKVLTFGAKKYDSWNWTTGGGFKWTRVLASCLRHIFAFMRGEDVDPESGISHISHAQCNLLFLAYYIRNKNKFPNDDRYVR